MASRGKARECENWYLHKFRSTYCTKMHRNPDIDVRTLQALMGHSDLASTLRYLRPAENVQTQAAVNRMKWFQELVEKRRTSRRLKN